MGSLALAAKMFWRTWRDAAFAQRAEELLERPEPPPADVAPLAIPTPAPTVATGQRSDAISLLAVLQREARLVDFLKEDISAYTNDQVGAAVRDVHRDAAAALERLFSLRPAVAQAEGASIAVPAAPDPSRMALIGNAGAAARGTVRHAGWEATHVQLPQWTGAAASARVIAPTEIEV